MFSDEIDLIFIMELVSLSDEDALDEVLLHGTLPQFDWEFVIAPWTENAVMHFDTLLIKL